MPVPTPAPVPPQSAVPGRLPARDVAAIESAVSVVPGVTRVVVSLGSDGQPEVLRVVLRDEVDPLDVARAAHRILRLQFGVGLDHGRIEVVEDVSLDEPGSVLRLVEEGEDGSLLLGQDVQDLLDDLDPGPGPRFGMDVLASAARHPAGVAHDDDAPGLSRHASGPRPAVARLSLSADGLGVTATVTLTCDGVEQSGSAEGPTTPAALHRCVAAATLLALRPSIGVGVRLDVDAVAIVAVGDSTAAVVRVIWLTPDGAEHLTGASEVRDDPRYAVIRATLDAVNRRLFLDAEA